MKVLLLNQFFHPDLSATAQMLTDLAEDLAASGLTVTALATRGSYLGGGALPARDEHRGVAIRRLWATSLGKRTLVHRALDYASFYASAALALATMPRQDVVLALTTPPLIAAAGMVARALRGSRLVYWVQDLYPEVAVAFGVMRPRSPGARLMAAVSRAVLSRADAVVALGEAMRERCVAAGARPDHTAVIPNWADGASVRPIPHHENPLRAELAQGARCLVMYSGNIGRGHDVATLVEAARRLRHRADIAFLFQGEGARRAAAERVAAELPNLRLGPYQPRERLAASLSAGDLHLVSLDPPLGGLLEPSQLYGLMAAGRPALFVGPAESEVARTVEREGCGAAFRNGDAEGLAAAVAALADDPGRREEMGRRAREALLARYDRRVATARFRDLVSSL
ncbi:MAG TPA: glycosyltransferase family 4 protein [Anaeromyxobacteraceae bacterium]|nr:glycosyltransferase family 4 protein [Anaeromyxobacteraceae bacterium]